MARMSQRVFLSRSAAAASAVSGGVLLQGCSKRIATGAAPGVGGLLLASPDNLITWPTSLDNEPIVTNATTR
jgi:hypothetical protein